jgi:uncharacterized FlaG/YvyC family protein
MDTLSKEQKELVHHMAFLIQDTFNDIKKFVDTYREKFDSASREDFRRDIFECIIKQSKDITEEIPKENLLKLLCSHVDDFTRWKDTIEDYLHFDVGELFYEE